MRTITSIVALGLLAISAEAKGKVSKGKCIDMPSVDAIDISMYSGVWYEAFREEAITFPTYDKGDCATATYTNKGDYIGVENNQRNIDGRFSTIRGSAYCVEEGTGDC